jgi:hypothetical protein
LGQASKGTHSAARHRPSSGRLRRGRLLGQRGETVHRVGAGSGSPARLRHDDADPHLPRSARPLQPPNCPGLIVAAYAPLVFLEGELLDAGRTALFAIALTVGGTYTNILGRPENTGSTPTVTAIAAGPTTGSARAFHGHTRFPNTATWTIRSAVGVTPVPSFGLRKELSLSYLLISLRRVPAARGDTRAGHHGIVGDFREIAVWGRSTGRSGLRRRSLLVEGFAFRDTPELLPSLISQDEDLRRTSRYLPTGGRRCLF